MNEGDTLAGTIESIVGTYPRLEIVVVDDGSDDQMTEVARECAKQYPGVKVVSRVWRGGKSSALNIAASHASGEILVAVDSDSHLDSDAVWEIVQPFANPQVGVVAATVRVRNAFTNSCTWMQGFEYLQSIFVGRKTAARLRILPIASGAFAAYRRDLVMRLGGWDIGPGEDLDMVLRIRKLGYRVDFAQYAYCHTEAPAKWKALFKQRRRWDGDGPVRHLLRKHNDIANPFAPNFRLSNLFTFLDGVTFNLLCGLFVLVWVATAICYPDYRPSGFVWLTMYAAAVAAEITPFFALMYYSRHRRTDAILSLAIPVMPIYRLALLAVRIYANVNEILWRISFTEQHVPPHVSAATWRW